MSSVPRFGDRHFREPVAELSDLPSQGNEFGDVRLVEGDSTLYFWNGSSWEPVLGGGTDTGITQLTGDVTAGPGSGSQVATLANTAVTPGSYGSATQVGTFTVDSKGRLTAAGNTTITGTSPVGSTLPDANIWIGSAANVAVANAITGDISLSNAGVTAINAGVIVNADINASAAIVDTKLATISTAGKVANSATTATAANTASAIVARDASGNFSAGTITATFTGTITGTVSLPDGSASTPSLFFTNDTNTGVFRVGTDNLGFAANGIQQVSIGTAGIVQERDFIILNNESTGTPSGTQGGMKVKAGSSNRAQMIWTEQNGGYWIASREGAATTTGVLTAQNNQGVTGNILMMAGSDLTQSASGVTSSGNADLRIANISCYNDDDGVSWYQERSSPFNHVHSINDQSESGGLPSSFTAQQGYGGGSSSQTGGPMYWTAGAGSDGGGYGSGVYGGQGGDAQWAAGSGGNSTTDADGGRGGTTVIVGGYGGSSVDGIGGVGGNTQIVAGPSGVGGLGNGGEGVVGLQANGASSGSYATGYVHVGKGLRFVPQSGGFESLNVDTANYIDPSIGYVQQITFVGGTGGYDGSGFGEIAGLTWQFNSGNGASESQGFGGTSNGGGFYITSGYGGDSSGNYTAKDGGGCNLAGGRGGDCSDSDPFGIGGGNGGQFQIASGRGGDVTGDTNQLVNAGSAGPVQVFGGTGGQANGPNTLAIAGNGGNIEYTGGYAGNAGGGTGGNGGSLVFGAGPQGVGGAGNGLPGRSYFGGGYAYSGAHGAVYIGYNVSFGALSNVAIKRSTSPDVAAHIGGAYATDSTSVSLTADNQSVSTTDKSYIILSSNNGTATNRTFTLTAGVAGQRLTIEWSGTNAGEILQTSTARLSATWTPTQYDTLTLIYSSNVSAWLEVSRSANA